MANTIYEGGCACGAIRYFSQSKPIFSFHCQCRQCQQATGSGHASAFIMPANKVLLKGELSYYDRTAANGHVVSQGFCPACGSPILNRNSGYPDQLYIHAASLDDPSLFRPERVIFRGDAQPWDVVNPKLP